MCLKRYHCTTTVCFSSQLLVLVLLHCVNSKTINSMAFEETINGKRLLTINTTSITAKSASKCGLFCNKKWNCRSFNFCDTQRCELNFHDIYSTTHGNALLSNDPSCVYFGMKKTSVPFCKQGELYVNVQNETDYWSCQIDKKRIDAEWGPWVFEAEIDTAAELKGKFEREKTIEMAHGGKNVHGVSEKPQMWIELVQESLSWDDSVVKCESLGGQLFSNFDGSDEQMKLITQKLNGERHWVGIYTTDHIIWRALDEVPLNDSQLSWIEGQPNNRKGSQNQVLISPAGLNDWEGKKKNHSICDLI